MTSMGHRRRGHSVPADVVQRCIDRMSVDRLAECSARRTWRDSSVFRAQQMCMPKATASHDTLDEELETEARASMALFGFGSSDNQAFNWKSVPFDSHKIGGRSVITSLQERTCLIGTNTFLYRLLTNTSDAPDANRDQSPCSDSEDGASCDQSDSDLNRAKIESAQDSARDSHILQRYILKSTVLIPGTLDEVVDLVIKSDRADIGLAMERLVGVKAACSKTLYSQSPEGPCADSDRPNDNFSRSSTMGSESTVRPPLSIPRFQTRTQVATPESKAHRRHIRPSHPLPYIQESASSSDVIDGDRSNLSVKYIEAIKAKRMFNSRVHYCLLDYDCVVINDWDAQGNCDPMYTRVMLSTYQPQFLTFHPLPSKLSDLQPTGIMVRRMDKHPGFVQVQFVGSILEKANSPRTSANRLKLRQLCIKIATLEDALLRRRFSLSFNERRLKWVPDMKRVCCSSCQSKFTLSRRRHHCRACGDICCSDCCPKLEIDMPNTGFTNIRICVVCSK